MCGLHIEFEEDRTKLRSLSRAIGTRSGRRTHFNWFYTLYNAMICIAQTKTSHHAVLFDLKYDNAVLHSTWGRTLIPETCGLYVGYCRQFIHVVRVRCRHGRRPQFLSRGQRLGIRTT